MREAWNKGQRESRIHKIISELDIESFTAYYESHSAKDTAKQFDIPYGLCLDLIRDLNLPIRSRGAGSRVSKQNRYGSPNYNNADKMVETKRTKNNGDYNSKETNEKISKTKSTKETQHKYEQTMIECYGYKHPNLVPSIRAKYTDTLMAHYGVCNPLKNKAIYEKHRQTMHDNNSFNTSKYEELFYNYLVALYGKDDVIEQYNDERYSNPNTNKPYNCDFYVKSIDKFFELNIHPSHGNHLFNEDNPEDVRIVEYLKSENSDWSHMILDVWTIRDVEKFNMATKSNLNIEFIYKNQFDEIMKIS